MSMSNQELIRRKLLDERLSLDAFTVKKKSNDIFIKAKDLIKNTDAKNILLYYSIKNEVETKSIIDYIIRLGRKVYLPVLISDNEFVAKEAMGKLEKKKHGIFEPVVGSIQQEFDLIICPGVAFDEKLNRLGFGGGYYDRYLMNYKNITKVGLAYEFQIVNMIYPQHHDVSMDMVITEKRVLIYENY